MFCLACDNVDMPPSEYDVYSLCQVGALSSCCQSGHKIAFDCTCIESFLAISNFYHLLMTFVNSMDPNQDWQNVCPDQEPNRLTL